LRLFDQAGIKGKEAKQVNMVLKAYYNRIPVSQEYFGIVDLGALWDR
jgi:hypothetical protein